MNIPPGHYPAIGELGRWSVPVETVEGACGTEDEPFLIPLGDIVVLAGKLRHSCLWEA